jgi:superfamily II DNA or RNA helicase
VILLHAGYAGGALWLWGEAAPAPRRKSRFVAIRELTAALERAGIPRAVTTTGALGRCEIVAWLPSLDGRVIPSSTLVADSVDGSNAEHAVVSPHAVPALALSPQAAIALLRVCGGRSLIAPGMAAAADLTYWLSLARFAARLVAEHAYVPTLHVERHGRHERVLARWTPRLNATRRKTVELIAASMPPAARALASADSPEPNASPTTIALEVMAILVDAMVRDAAASRKPPSAETPHDRWLDALGNVDAEVLTDRAFREHVEAWVRDATIDDDAGHRLCFRLEEPTDERQSWFVRFLLQAHDDPSLLVDVETAWKNVALRSTFLGAIGRAARTLPAIDAALRERRPIGYELDDSAAYAFLRDDCGRLDGAGYGVLMPTWWTNGPTSLTVRAKASTRALPSGARMGLDQIVAITWSAALAGRNLSMRELNELARLKMPLVQVRGQWMVVDARQIEAARELVAQREERTRLGDVAMMAWTGRGPVAGLTVDEVTGTGRVGETLGRLTGRSAFADEPVPSLLNGTLRHYQVRGYSWLAFLSRLGLGACLADQMGLGKSITTLALIARDWEADPSTPVLLICPTSVIGNWEREVARFAPSLPMIVHHGAERSKSGRIVPKRGGVAILVTSYNVATRDAALLAKHAWRGIVIDEAQNVKNPHAKQSIALRGLRAGYRIALTGTPVENHVGDLWALMDFLNPGLLGDATSFRRNFHIPITASSDARAEALLKRMTAPFVLRRLKSDPTIAPDLPKKHDQNVYCQLTKEQASLYAAVLRDVDRQLDELGGMERRGMVFATMMKLKQIANHPANFLHDRSALESRSGKLERLTEMLGEVIASGERALIFTQFTEMAELLQRHLQESTGKEVLYLHGGTPRKARDEMVDRFQRAADAPHIFILSLRAGGTGITLTRANHVFHYDRWWNPAVEHQASDRAYRIGQTKNVYVHRLICAGTFEEKLDAMLDRKGKLAERLVRSGEAGLTELTSTQLRALFALEPDAVLAT